MHTSIVWLALSGLASAVDVSTPTWRSDYSQARRQGAAQNKPLAVFLSPGKHGWGKLSNEGTLSSTAKELLAERYVCVHVDTATAAGRQLASAFEIPDGVGLVISDRTGQLQAFHHAGHLPRADLNRYLERYSAPDRSVRVTETHASTRTSFYPAPSTPSIPSSSIPATLQGWTQPSYGYSPGFSGFSGFSGGGRGGC